MTAALALLAALALGQPPADPPRSVLTAADGRPVYGWPDRGQIRFYPAEQTPENLAPAGPAIGDGLANGVQIEGLRRQPAGTFTTNDPAFDPARCTPDPTAPVGPSIPFPVPIACVVAAAGFVLYARRRSPDHP